MNTENTNTVATHTESMTAPRKGHGKKKKKNIKSRGPEVTYLLEELIAAEGQPFWEVVHDAEITVLNDEGLLAKIQKDGQGTIEVRVPKEEICAFHNHQAGQKIRLYLNDLTKSESEEGALFSGSEIKAIELDLLDQAEAAFKNGEIVPGHVLSPVKGGFSLALFAKNRDDAENGFGLRAFLPMGRASLRRILPLETVELESPQIDVKISEYDPVLGNIIVSRREVLQASRKEGEEAFFASLKVGDVVNGKISAVMPYGAFVNLGQADGFLHISDLSWDKRPRLKELQVGKDITARIIEIKDKKIKLSIKDLNPDPWQNIEKHLRPGMQVKGTIVAFADFGAFVRLENGIEGLVHAGEISWSRVKHPSTFFKLGDEVTAAVLRVDKETKRVSLSTKELETSPVERLSGQFPVGTVVKTKIASIEEFGLFVELDEHTHGLVPRSEISWTRSDEPLDKQFTVGQEIEVAIWGYDSRRQRVTCSLKRTHKDPWPEWKQKYRRGSVHQVKVLRSTKDGLLCELENGLTGFVPKGQLLSAENDSRVAVKQGEMIEAVVTALDPLKQSVSLSQKAALENETNKAYQSYLHEQSSKGGAKTTLADAFKSQRRN